MKPTRWVPLVSITAIALAIGWVTVDIVDAVTGRILGVPWLAAAGLWVLALAVLGWTLLSRGRLGESPSRLSQPVPVDPRRTARAPGERMPPLVAARTAALALAASRTGTLIGGFYLGIALGLLPVVSSPTGSASVTAAAACVLACVVLVAAALWLERLCRVHDDATDS